MGWAVGDKLRAKLVLSAVRKETLPAWKSGESCMVKYRLACSRTEQCAWNSLERNHERSCFQWFTCFSNKTWWMLKIAEHAYVCLSVMSSPSMGVKFFLLGYGVWQRGGRLWIAWNFLVASQDFFVIPPVRGSPIPSHPMPLHLLTVMGELKVLCHAETLPHQGVPPVQCWLPITLSCGGGGPASQFIGCELGSEPPAYGAVRSPALLNSGMAQRYATGVFMAGDMGAVGRQYYVGCCMGLRFLRTLCRGQESLDSRNF